MNPRVRLVLVGAGVCLAAGLLAAVLALAPGRAGGGGAGDGATLADGFAGATRPPTTRPFDVALRDEEGRRFRLADLRGDVVIVTFMYTTCEDTCPLQADQVRGALDLLGDEAPPAVAVSVDPPDDTARRARGFLLDRRLTGRMRFLLGTRAELEPVWREYGVRPQGQGFEHSANVVLLDASGRQRVGFPLDQLTPEGLAADVRRLRALGVRRAGAADTLVRD